MLLKLVVMKETTNYLKNIPTVESGQNRYFIDCCLFKRSLRIVLNLATIAIH